MANPLEEAEKVLERAADVYEKTMNGDGLLQTATTWLAIWEHQKTGQRQFGFSNQPDEEQYEQEDDE